MEYEVIAALVGMGILMKKQQDRYVTNMLICMEANEKEKDLYNQEIMYLAVLLAQQNKLTDTMIINMMKMEGDYNE